MAGGILISGRIFQLAILIVFFCLLLIAFYLGRRGWSPKIRKISGLEAMSEAMARCAEMGRPAHWTGGTPGATTYGFGASGTSDIIASVQILGYLAELAGKYQVRLLSSTGRTDEIPVILGYLEQGYKVGGRPELFKPEDTKFYPVQVWTMGITSRILKENVAANFPIGGITFEAAIFGETAASIGAMQVSGTSVITAIPFLIASCDYVLISEEMYVAGAVVSKDTLQLSTVAGEDWIKVVILACIIFGSIFATVGSTILKDLFKM